MQKERVLIVGRKRFTVERTGKTICLLTVLSLENDTRGDETAADIVGGNFIEPDEFGDFPVYTVALAERFNAKKTDRFGERSINVQFRGFERVRDLATGPVNGGAAGKPQSAAKAAG